MLASASRKQQNASRTCHLNHRRVEISLGKKLNMVEVKLRCQIIVVVIKLKYQKSYYLITDLLVDQPSHSRTNFSCDKVRYM